MSYVLNPIESMVDPTEFFLTNLEAKDALRLKDVTPHLSVVVAAVNEALAKSTGYCPTGSTTTEYLNGGGYYLLTTNRPVTAIASIYDMVSGEDVDPSLYELRDAEEGLIYATGGANARWSRGLNRFRITYTAGIASPPSGLKTIAAAMVAAQYEVGQAGGETTLMSEASISDMLREYVRIG